MKAGNMIFIIIFILLILGLAVLAFIKSEPRFGADEIILNKEHALNSKNYKNEKFFNKEPSKANISWKTKLTFLFFDLPRPKDKLPVVKLDDNYFDTNKKGQTRLTWFGHSAVFLELDDKKIFLDPMLTNTPSPVNFLGKKRYFDQLPMAINKIPQLDAIVISHDHYDHLDYKSITKLADKTKHFYVPLGVGSHLVIWGIEPDRITELDWWQSAKLDNIELTLAPMRHFSGRNFNTMNQTLWGSWAIKGKKHNIFFSGDGGYSKYFKQIGEKLGPFDLAMIESGQYNKEWPNSHLMPSQSIRAHKAINADIMLPIHWAAFTLSLHNWKEPIEKISKLASKHNINLTTPKIGESVIIGKPLPKETWWEDIK